MSKSLWIVLVVCAATAALSGSTQAAMKKEPEVADRGLVIAVASDAPPEVKAAADSIKAAAGQQPLLKAMAAGHEIQSIDSATLLSGHVEERAFNHVIVVGLPSDPLITDAWQREAKVEDDGMFIFGFGHFKGTIGYIESDRNPYMHSSTIAKAPYETEFVTITGTNAAGVALAAKAFVQRGIINGVIGTAGNWSRPSTSLLDRDPVAPDAALPDAPAKMGSAPVIGVSQASEDEYRNVLADTGVEPTTIWRFKYLTPGAWDAGGVESAIAEYKAGLHRRAFGDTVWAGVFPDATSATAAAGKIAAAAGLKGKGNAYTGAGKPGEGTPLEVWTSGTTVYMTDLKR